MRGGDVARRVQMGLDGGLREALVGREAVGHEAQAGVGLGGHEAGRQDAGHAARRQHRAAAADVAQRGRRAHQVLARQQPAPACRAHALLRAATHITKLITLTKYSTIF